MILSGFLSRSEPGGRKSRPSSAQRSPTFSSQGFFSNNSRDAEIVDDDSVLLKPETEEPDLHTLNESLDILTMVFPDVQAEVFREMLMTFDDESRLHVVTEALLRHKTQWTKGRWRVPGKDAQPVVPSNAGAGQDSQAGAILPAEDRFRSSNYKKAVRTALCQEFRGLSRSTIDGVLAEHNHSYTLARPTLLILSSKSWRFSISSFFQRKKLASSMDPSRHPLVLWRASDGSKDGTSIPALRGTESPELNRELYDTLIRPLKRQAKDQQLSEDHVTALQMNDTEADENDALQDCECCFTSTSFEQLSACSEGRHFICFRCLRHAASEALFGQGWTRNTDQERCSLRCIAPVLDGSGDCEGFVSQGMVRRALDEEVGGGDIWTKMEQRFAENGLRKSQKPLVRCSFCSYAEMDDLYLPDGIVKWKFKRANFLSFWTFIWGIISGLVTFALPLYLLCLLSLVVYLTINQLTFGNDSSRFDNSLRRLARKSRGLKFNCQSSTCGRSSCLVCSKEWRDIHICYESERLALRSYVERAMAEAVKRTCPICNLSFVKASGCNKLTCVCGYKMCYVCRKEIGKDGYRHFCEHFRPDGDRLCRECDKCDLYRCEDEATAIRNAGNDAEREWRTREGMNHGWSWEGRDDFAGNQKMRGSEGFGIWEGWKGLIGAWRNGNWQHCLDILVERLIDVR
ncbi:MAG: ergosterol biosynthesis protein [Chaenotheca gracillima]|nr:MAG: ergosterol biosynthesis protein [Chaenotheca gracillima]